MWYIYIVKCQDDSFYVGTSSDLTRRFQEHKDGRGGKYTSHHKPSKIIYSESFDKKEEAFKREKQLKGWSRKKKENLVRYGKQITPA